MPWLQFWETCNAASYNEHVIRHADAHETNAHTKTSKKVIAPPRYVANGSAMTPMLPFIALSIFRKHCIGDEAGTRPFLCDLSLYLN